MCNKPIQEDGCTAFGKVYHKACFKCHACKQKIQGKFFERGGKPYCEKDYMVSGWRKIRSSDGLYCTRRGMCSDS